jgi:glycosyltransferase involved in cell wall biosynthesis
VRKEPLGVVFVLANGGRGGMQSQVLTIAGSLALRGHRVTIAVGGATLDAPPGVDVVRLPTYSTTTWAGFVLSLRRVVREQRADVVHGHGLRLAPALRMSGAQRRYVSCHGLDPLAAARGARLARWSGVDVISCGQGPRELLARYGVKSRVIDNAFSENHVRHSASELRGEFSLIGGVPLIVLPARYSQQKGHDLLLDALSIVRNELGELSPEVVCFGDGPLEQATRQRAQFAVSRPLAHILPYRSDAASWLSASDFFVLPSRWEGQPLVVLEALSCGLSVATITEGLGDLVVDGKNGCIAPNVDSLARTIVAWSKDPASRPRNNEVTQAILAEHSLETVTDRYESLYYWS